jgi:glycosyltransferase involved in cell wall biosynthesis
MSRPIRVVNIAEFDTSWHWIAETAPGAQGDWAYVSTRRRPGLETKIKFPNFGRVRGSIALRRTVKAGYDDLIVSHGPLNCYYGIEALGRRADLPHLAMSFNFTEIPDGWRRKLMCRAYQAVDRFVVFSRMERQLYSGIFGVPEDRFDFLHWGVQPPITAPLPRAIAEPYFIAIGNEARDYRPLVEAARMRPNYKFVFIVRPWTLDGLDVPDNVTVHCNLPWEQTWSLAWYATAALISLRSSQTPNGHVSIVGGMHIGKAHIVSDSAGITDYAIQDETALLVPTGDPEAFVRAMDRLMDEPETAKRLGDNALAFANAHCTEQRTVDYFGHYIADLRAQGRLPA